VLPTDFDDNPVRRPLSDEPILEIVPRGRIVDLATTALVAAARNTSVSAASASFFVATPCRNT
jgi:hypothetical protein